MVDFFSGILAMEVHQSGFLSSRHTRPSRRERTSWPSPRTFLRSANRHYIPPTMLLLINTLFPHSFHTRNTTSFANNLLQRVSLSSSIFLKYTNTFIYLYIYTGSLFTPHVRYPSNRRIPLDVFLLPWEQCETIFP